MRHPKAALIAVCLGLITTTAWAGQPFALVELYTSQGCSSCPPADAVLRQLTHKAEEEKLRIFPLSFHVDYWDRLGWKDPYANKEYTLRQNLYSRAFDRNNVYTPQMVINGRYEFGGYKSQIATDHINDELAKPATPVDLTFRQSMADPTTVRVDYTVKPLVKDAVIHVAIAEKNISNQVERGENAGKRLAHDNVVRSFRSKNLNSPSGSITLQIPEDINMSVSSAVVFVQHRDTMRVLAAESAEFYAPDSIAQAGQK